MQITNRKQWLEARKNGIGASEAAASVGLSPWKSNARLWEEKTGRITAPDISDKPAVKYGSEAEEYIRALFALDFPEFRVDYDQFGMIRNNQECPWAFATLDGDLTETTTGRKGVLEIKTTEIQRSSQWSEWDGKVPQHYYIQVLHQLLATGYDFAILKAQIKYTDRNGGKQAAIRHYRIERSDVLDDIKWLATREERFWRYVETDTRPPEILPEI